MIKFTKRKKIRDIDHGRREEESLVANGPGYHKTSYRFVQKKSFSEDDEQKKKGMSTMAKVGLGVGAAALAGTGAYRGWFGAGAQKFMGRSVANVGNAFGNQSMIKAGTQAYGKGQYKSTVNNLTKLNEAGKLKSGGQNVLKNMEADKQKFVDKFANAETTRIQKASASASAPATTPTTPTTPAQTPTSNPAK